MYGNTIIKDKYTDELLQHSLQIYFGVELTPAQLNILKSMLINDYVLFNHGRGVGATFLLSLLSVILRLLNPKISIVVAAEYKEQAKFFKMFAFKQKFNKYNMDDLPVVDIDKAISGNYDILLLDGITKLSKEHIEGLISCIESKSKLKIIAVCTGYRQYYPITALASVIYRHGEIVTMSYKDMPIGWFDLGNIDEAKKSFKFEEEFNMEYKGYIY